MMIVVMLLYKHLHSAVSVTAGKHLNPATTNTTDLGTSSNLNDGETYILKIYNYLMNQLVKMM